MITSIFEYQASERLGEQGFFEKPLSDFKLPQVRAVNDHTPFKYAEFGNTNEAANVILSPLPFSNQLEDKAMQLRLNAQQQVLGNDFAVVGLEVYNPNDMRLSAKNRKKIADGSFEPLSDRVFAAIDWIKPDKDQKLGVYGYSMGGDVGAETAYRNLTSIARGEYEFKYLGVFEPARSKNRGRLAVAMAFSRSGGDLFDNVVASKSPALLEARGIDLKNPDAQKEHFKQVGKAVVSYVLKDLSGAAALAKGFGHDTTVKQLVKMWNKYPLSMPHATIGRMNRSTIFPGDVKLPNGHRNKLTVIEHDGDHSAADNLIRSGGFMLETVFSNRAGNNKTFLKPVD